MVHFFYKIVLVKISGGDYLLKRDFYERDKNLNRSGCTSH